MRQTTAAAHVRAHALALLAMPLLAACAVPTGAALGTATPASARSPRAVWLAAVELPDAVDSGTATALTLSLKQYLEASGHFERVGLLPAEVGERDLILRLRFSRYRQTRSIHPAYLPGALLTLSVYIFVGGPVYTDSIDLEATLEGEDAAGHGLASATRSKVDRQNVSFLDTEYFMPSGMLTRTDLVRELLDELVARLDGEEE